MRKLKRENKGFSLVELIVVVLILGILAVAVTPQVMKWVGKSKISADKDSANALKSAVTTALADWQGQGGKIHATNDYDANVDANGALQIATGDDAAWGDDNATSGKSLKDYIDEITAGDYPKAQYEMDATYGSFEITIEAGTGKVSVDYKAKNVSE